MKSGNKEKIPCYIADTGNGHCDKRRDRVSDSPEDTADQVIGNDDQHAGPADPHISHGEVKGLCRGLHDLRDHTCSRCAKYCKDNSYAGKKYQACADSLPSLFGLAAPDLLSQQNCRAHGKAGYQICQRQHDLRSCRNSGDMCRHISCICKAAYDHQIDRTVHSLQKERRQDRQRKPHQRQ